MATPQEPNRPSEKGPHPLLISPPPAHFPPERSTETLRPLSLLLSQPRRPDAAIDAVESAHCSPSSISPLFPDDRQKHQRGDAPSRVRALNFFCGGSNPALSSAAILVGAMLTLTLVPAWIGFRILIDVRVGGSDSNPKDLPPFWYVTLVGASTALVIGLVLGLIVGLRARHSPEMPTSGLTFLVEDWVGRAAGAGCLVLGMFALPLGMAVFGHASAYRAVDGLLMGIVGLGTLCVLAVGGFAGYVLWHSVRGERRRRKLLAGYKY